MPAPEVRDQQINVRFSRTEVALLERMANQAGAPDVRAIIRHRLFAPGGSQFPPAADLERLWRAFNQASAIVQATSPTKQHEGAVRAIKDLAIEAAEMLRRYNGP